MPKTAPLTKKEKAELKRLKDIQVKKNRDMNPLEREPVEDRLRRAEFESKVEGKKQGGKIMKKKGYSKGGMMKKKGYAMGGMTKKKGYAMGGMMKKGYAKGGPTKKKGAKKSAKKGGKVRGVGIAKKGFRPVKMR